MEGFKNWLAGFTDGDGSFSVLFNKKKNIWNLTYKLSQSTYNIKLIYYIKKLLQVGHVTIEKKRQIVNYRIRDKKQIKEILIPLFDQSPLLTSKFADYLIFKEACIILTNTGISKDEKNTLIYQLKRKLNEYKYYLKYTNGLDSLYQGLSNNNILINMSDEWLVGFWEAEGSFYITKAGENYYRHTISITQKLDKKILDTIRDKLKIKSKVKYKPKHDYYYLTTSHSRSLENVKTFFYKKLKGRKSLEFSIWSRTLKYRKNSEKLQKIQILMQKMRRGDREISKPII